MNAAHFGRSAPGRLVRVPEGVPAFVPDPLPPKLELRLPTINLLSRADAAVGELRGIGHMLPNAELLIGPLLRREAVFSSRIEGTATTMQQLALFEADAPEGTTPADAREVANYVLAVRHGLRRLSDLPVCLRLIREMHERLLAGIAGPDRRPGEFRTVQNFITGDGPSIADARFVPPPPQEMTGALHELERFIGSGSGLPPLIDMALVHYQFEAIHPFIDGNGRIGRALITLLMCERGLLSQPLLSLSPYFERHRDQYVDLLFAVSTRGAWTEWTEFFLEAVADQAEHSGRIARRLLELRERYREQVQASGRSALPLQVVDRLFEVPAISVPAAAERLQVTYRSAQLIAGRLVELGILAEAPTGRRPRMYVAPGIIEVLQSGVG